MVFECKDKDMALAVIQTIIEPMKPGTTRNALESVYMWIQQNRSLQEITKMSPEEREARILELLSKREAKAKV